MSTQDSSNPSQRNLLRLLAPVCRRIADLHPEQRHEAASVAELEVVLEREFPSSGSEMLIVAEELRSGIAAGWACNRGPEEARFSRLAKPGPETHGFSIDAVSMIGKAIDHTHPLGEVTIGFPADPKAASDCQFEGRKPGWVFLPPKSRHVPTVTSDRMNLIYFLPEGAVEWHTT